MKKSMTIRLDDELLERAKNAVWNVGRGLNLTLLIEEGLLAQVEELEKKHNKGKRFPQREDELPHSSKRG